MQAMLVGMRPQPGHKESHPRARGRAVLPYVYGGRGYHPGRWVALFMRVAQHPATRFVVLILLMMLQMVLLWLLGQMVDLCISLMEVWVELARKHLEITL
jgi:hypothetical protein